MYARSGSPVVVGTGIRLEHHNRIGPEFVKHTAHRWLAAGYESEIVAFSAQPDKKNQKLELAHEAGKSGPVVEQTDRDRKPRESEESEVFERVGQPDF